MQHTHHYRRLLAMIALSFVAMYVLMYAMVNIVANAVPNLNQAYMAGLMAAPMVLIELGLMGAMYENKKLNLVLIAGGVAALLLCWIGIRQQFAITDEQFLKSMIPHHAGAILMCEKASLEDAAVKDLCKGIISSQTAEIAQMKAMLKERDSR